MKVFTKSATITAGSYYGGTTGYDSGIFGSISASLHLMNNPLDVVYWYQGSIYFQLDDGCTGNSGWWRIKIGNTYYYRKDATFTSSQYYARWVFTGVTTNPFSSGQTINFEIDSVRELLAELAIDSASNNASYGYVNESSTNIHGDVSRLYNFTHSGHHEIRKFYYYVAYNANQLFISFKKHNIPNSGWTSVCVNGHYFRRSDAVYTTTSSSGGMTNWSWTDIDENLFINPATGDQDILIEFYSHDEELERMKDGNLMRHHGRIDIEGFQSATRGFQKLLNQNTQYGTMMRDHLSTGFSSKRFGLTNQRIVELSYNPTTDEVKLCYLVKQEVANPKGDIDYLRINDTTFHIAEAEYTRALFSSMYYVTFTWSNITNDPWESIYYSSSSNPIEFEVGKYDDTVYVDCFHFRDTQNYTRSVTLDVNYQTLMIITSHTGLLSNSYNLNITGLPTGTGKYELSGNRGVLLDFSEITYTGPFTVSIGQQQYTSTVTVTNDPTPSIGVQGFYSEKRLTHVNYINRDTSGGTYAVTHSPTLERKLATPNVKWRSYVYADPDNFLTVERAISDYSEGTASLDTLGTTNATLSQTHALNWDNNYPVDIDVTVSESDFTIEWNHTYTFGTSTLTFDSRLEVAMVGGITPIGLAVKSPAGVKRLEPIHRMPRIFQVVSGTATNGGVLSQPTGLTNSGDTETFHCCQVHPFSRWGAVITNGQVVLSDGNHTNTMFQQFSVTNDYAVLIFKG